MKICVLTSGGDAPGMNAAIRAVVKAGTNSGHEVFGIKSGYKGLLEGDMIPLTAKDVSGFLGRAGTALGSARSKEFNDNKIKKKGADLLKKKGVDCVIAIGGEGTAKGARDLAKYGNIKTMLIPATIDNDYPGTDFAIGFHTALNTIVDATQKLKDTSSSHNRCSVVEVMGRDSGYLATFAAICTGAEILITSKNDLNEKEIYKKLKGFVNENRNHALIVITEHICDVSELAKKITDKTGFETRATVLGHIQRGGNPVPYDRMLATEFGEYAIRLINKKIFNVSVGKIKDEMVHMDIDKALARKQELKKYLDIFYNTI